MCSTNKQGSVIGEKSPLRLLTRSANFSMSEMAWFCQQPVERLGAGAMYANF
jgi:hypothetical protein